MWKSTLWFLRRSVHCVHCTISCFSIIIFNFFLHIHVFWRIYNFFRNIIMLTILSFVLFVCKSYSLFCWKSIIKYNNTSMLALILFLSNYNIQVLENIYAFQNLAFFPFQLDSFWRIILLILNLDHIDQDQDFLDYKLLKIHFWGLFCQPKILVIYLKLLTFLYRIKLVQVFFHFHQEVFFQNA